MNISNNNEACTEPCGTPEKILKKLLEMMFISTHCLWFLK